MSDELQFVEKGWVDSQTSQASSNDKLKFVGHCDTEHAREFEGDKRAVLGVLLFR